MTAGAPVTRSRSGNALRPARGAVLAAAAHCVERHGVRRTTMADIARRAGVAKGTLYNHFRTKDDVLAGLVAARLDQLVSQCAAVAAGRPLPAAAVALPSPDVGSGLAAALQVAAAALASSGPLRRVAADDAPLAVRLASGGDGGGGDGGGGWDAARAGVRCVLAAGGARTDDAAVALVLRWLAGQVLWPAAPEEARATAGLLAAAVARPEQGVRGGRAGYGESAGDRPPSRH